MKEEKTEQEEIKYIDIMSLGFNESFKNDKVFFNEYGFQYTIITRKLSKTIYLDWSKETRLCKIVRIDSPKKCNIMAENPVKNLETVSNFIKFFTDEN